ncbi:SDR family oxidoreductase [Brucella gallinifaecis]|uniref:SDR family oxidoreductase n=1 Tax=Brucella gallinifaecis TaxID=215590 RepID=UPI00235EA28F|nr:SDR family oxidoreductase [Brucella gallinifaecis]
MKPVVVVTGGGRGIGAAIAVLFAQEGYNVCISYVSDVDAALATVKACESFGAKAIAVRSDVANREDVADLFTTCDGELGAPQCLINNAGVIGQATRIAGLEAEALEQTFKTNVFGLLYCIQEATRRMSTAHGGVGGTIINISSVAAVLGSPGEYVHYAASKGAVETISIGAGKELASEGIRVNAIRVGTTNTSIHALSGNPDRPAKIAAMTPMGRIAEPEDIAHTALWLASDKSGFVTGTVITVAGGLSA